MSNIGIIIGFDLGRFRCGWAISDILKQVAIPKDSFSLRKDCKKLKLVKQFVLNNRIDGVVIGRPLSPLVNDVNKNKYTEAQCFLMNYLELKDTKVCFQDERFSSSVYKGSMPRVKDGLAAALILQEFISSNYNILD